MIKFYPTEHGSHDYYDALSLRYDVLRKPLGLVYAQEDIDAEINQIHVVGKLDDVIVCTASIQPFDNYCKIRQVAVDTTLQKQSIGKQLIQYCEAYILKMGFFNIKLHSRVSVVDFYLKMQYQKEGGVFTEVSIPHIIMVKYFCHV